MANTEKEIVTNELRAFLKKKNAETIKKMKNQKKSPKEASRIFESIVKAAVSGNPKPKPKKKRK